MGEILTQGLFEVNNSVVVLEHIDLIDVGKWLNSYLIMLLSKYGSEKRARLTELLDG